MINVRKVKVRGSIAILFQNHRNGQTSVKDPNYQFIQRSKVPTMHFQKSLPRLPVPDLVKTGARYLNALRPLLTDVQYGKAQQRTTDFIAAEGKVLQEKLLFKDKRNKHTSYISEYWLDLYLSDRAPLPINHNPLIVFQNDVREPNCNQLVRSTNLLISVVRFMLSLREQLLEPEVYHLNPKESNNQLFRTVTSMLPEAVSCYGANLFQAFPRDMSQFPGLFGATRIPRLNKDEIFRDPKSKHVVVQRNGKFYVFDVLDSDGNLLSPTEILGNLSKIVTYKSPAAEHPLGVLTCQERNKWAKQRAHLESTGNSESLRAIDSAIFNLVLDTDNIAEDKRRMVRQYLCGDGLNRWFDKPFSLIVTRDGESGGNIEHSWGDGVTVQRFFRDIYTDTIQKSFVHSDSRPATTNITIRELEFNIDDKTKIFIEDAKKEYKTWCDTLSIDCILYEGLTKETCKKHNVSPDFIMQLGFQLLCEGLNLRKKSKYELRALLQECSNHHLQLIKEAAMGQGFDRHMFALKKLAEENNIKPEIFDSYEYKHLNNTILSTSTVSSLAVAFGPVVKEGFGIGYSAQADKLVASVTSYKTHNDSADFIKALHESFKEIKKIL